MGVGNWKHGFGFSPTHVRKEVGHLKLRAGAGPSSRRCHRSWQSEGLPQAGGGALASWPGAAILVVPGAVTPLYPQVNPDDSGVGPKKMQALPSPRAVVMSMSLQIHGELVICVGRRCHCF